MAQPPRKSTRNRPDEQTRAVKTRHSAPARAGKPSAPARPGKPSVSARAGKPSASARTGKPSASARAGKPPAKKVAPAAPAPLGGKQRSFLRGLGHHLTPIVLVGKEGVSDGLVAATGAALEQHELIKVRFGESAGDRHALAGELAERTRAELAQVLGRTALLYRARAEEPAIKLP